MPKSDAVILAEIKKDVRYLNREFTYFRKEIGEILAKHDEAIDTNEKSVIKISERQSVWNYGLMILNVVIGAVASYFGLRRQV